METTRKQQVVGLAKISPPNAAAAHGAVPQLTGPALPLPPCPAKRSGGGSDAVGDWIKARSDMNNSIDTMGSLDSWLVVYICRLNRV